MSAPQQEHSSADSNPTESTRKTAPASKAEDAPDLVSLYISHDSSELMILDGTLKIPLKEDLPIQGPFDMFGLAELIVDIVNMAEHLFGPGTTLKFQAARNARGLLIRRVTMQLTKNDQEWYSRELKRMAQNVRQLDFERL